MLFRTFENISLFNILNLLLRIMKYIYLLVSLFLLVGCKSVKNQAKPEGWFNVALAEDIEIYTDTASIRHEGSVAYAREKRVYLTADSKKAYVDKIRAKYAEMGKTEKAEKWDDFSYCVYECLYECTNKRFRILSVEDFDSTGKRIIKTTPEKNKEQWLNVEPETVGDYTFFFVCDYGE
jgi:hypothetical protein